MSNTQQVTITDASEAFHPTSLIRQVLSGSAPLVYRNRHCRAKVSQPVRGSGVGGCSLVPEFVPLTSAPRCLCRNALLKQIAPWRFYWSLGGKKFHSRFSVLSSIVPKYISSMISAHEDPARI